MSFRRFSSVILGSLLFSWLAVAQMHDEHPAAVLDEPKKPVGAVRVAKVYFISPKDGASVGKEFTAKFAVEGLKVAKAGEIVPGTGHFHILIDTPALAEGQVIPTDEKHLHYGQGQTEAKLKLAPGPHTLTLQFADGAHRAYTKMLTQEIKVIVK